MDNVSHENDRRRHVRDSHSTAELDELVTSTQNARVRFSVDDEAYHDTSASLNGAFADDQRALLHARSSSRDDDIQGNEGEWTDRNGHYPPNGRGRARSLPRFYGEDFYIRMGEAWCKTQRKRRLKAYGSLGFTLFQEAWYAKWTVKVQLAFLIAVFVTSMVFSIHIYHHSHFKPYPWRIHCASQPEFPMQKYLDSEQVGVFVGVMTMASEKAAKRRNQIRNSWASHWASRGRWATGGVLTQDELRSHAGNPNALDPTARTVVRFVMGHPRPEWRERIQQEMSEYNDIIILPMRENMNDGKTFAFFDWSFKHALVPSRPSNLTSLPPIPDSSSHDADGGYGRRSPRPPRPSSASDGSLHGWALHNAYDRRPPAPHDPVGHNGERSAIKDGWTRPDFVVKADDDSFIMLAELEARLRVLDRKGVYWGYPVRAGHVDFHAGEAYALSWDLVGHVSTYAHRHERRSGQTTLSLNATLESDVRGKPPLLPDLIKSSSRRRASEVLRGRKSHWHGKGRKLFQDLSLNIVGREDQVTAGWMKDHGEEWGVTWYDERCWVYDGPKAGTVYSKGFLFPDEVARIRTEWSADGRQIEPSSPSPRVGREEQESSRPEYKRLHDPTYSTVLRAFYRNSYPFAVKWATLYKSPLSFLSFEGGEDVEMATDALIEGSKLSMLSTDSGDDTSEASRRWNLDIEHGWRGRYLLGSVDSQQSRVPIGGSVVVHYIKQDQHWNECVGILLDAWKREKAHLDTRG